jgi:hypothetical protein
LGENKASPVLATVTGDFASGSGILFAQVIHFMFINMAVNLTLPLAKMLIIVSKTVLILIPWV